MTETALPEGVTVRGAGHEAVLTAGALAFVAGLVRRHGPAVQELLAARRERQKLLDAGGLPDFAPETAGVREGAWRVDPVPAILDDRRVELTGPVDRKMIINALNSGARVFMADFEDSTSPTWANVLEGQQNLFDAVRGTINYTAPETGRAYALDETRAVLFVRPRGLHLPERHLLVDGEVAPGSLVDFGLFFYHNALEQCARGAGPFFYLPKLEHHTEARWWNSVFLDAQAELGLPAGTIKATVLIETLPAAFQMHEILHELRAHSAGLNCGRWDYIFSYLKKLRAHGDRLLPDRAQVTMDKAFLKAYSQLLIQTCHRRGAHAMGGMAAQIPIKGDPAANEQALARVRADKLREVTEGHDGTWVAHPALVPVARELFDAHMPGPNQLARTRDELSISQEDLLRVHEGSRTEEGLRHNVRVGVQYLEAWLRGQGCVPLYNLMEDAATAELSRAQVWQQVHHRATLSDGSAVSAERVRAVLGQELDKLRDTLGEARFASGRFAQARALFERLALAPECEDFLTLPAYELLPEG